MDQVNNQQLVLRYKDANATFNKELTNKIESICSKKGISYIFKDEFVEEQNKILLNEGLKTHSIGSTEMGRIIAASNGLLDGTTIQIPTSGYHTLQETASRSSCRDFQKVLLELY